MEVNRVYDSIVNIKGDGPSRLLVRRPKRYELRVKKCGGYTAVVGGVAVRTMIGKRV